MRYAFFNYITSLKLLSIQLVYNHQQNVLPAWGSSKAEGKVLI
jgi:hypothetical protein